VILTGPAIEKELYAGRICINPFRPSRLNPNSYNYTLDGTLRTCNVELSPTTPSTWETFEIPADGFVLEPNRLYLGATRERIGSTHFVPSLIGRSSLGRLGMFLQASADMGNLGAIHRWTLEISVVQPLRIYAGMSIGQVSFWVPEGSVVPYRGQFANWSVPTTCHGT
jgi:dCTP deaminase